MTEAAAGQPFAIFRKGSQRRSMTFLDYLADIEAADPASALAQAITQFDDAEGLVWWVIPRAALYGTGEDSDIVKAWFDPAKTKTYKQQSQYGFVSQRRKGRKG